MDESARRELEEFFAEVERIAPDVLDAPSGGFSYDRPTSEVLATLRALPDRAGEVALLAALGIPPDGDSPAT